LIAQTHIGCEENHHPYAENYRSHNSGIVLWLAHPLPVCLANHHTIKDLQNGHDKKSKGAEPTVKRCSLLNGKIFSHWILPGMYA
jgi:hypothetical protein